MRHYGVTLSEVMNVTREMNLNANGGVLYEYGNEYIVRGVLSTDKVDQIAKAVVRSNWVSGSRPAGRYCRREDRSQTSETGYRFGTR